MARGSTFKGRPIFFRSTFQAVFSDDHFGEPPDFQESEFEGKFSGLAFPDGVTFSGNALDGSIIFENVSFEGDAFFQYTNRGAPVRDKVWDYPLVQFFGATFKGRLYFEHNSLKVLDFEPFLQPGLPLQVTFAKEANFTDTSCLGFSCSKAEFLGPAIFEQCQFGKEFGLSDVSFRDNVDFKNTVFPPREYVKDQEWPIAILSNIRFDKRVDVNWWQVANSTTLLFFDSPLVRADVDTWKSLGGALKLSDNLKGQNEAFYYERLEALHSDPHENGYLNTLSWVFWGYGKRPIRAMLWIVISIIAFALVYSTQLDSLWSALLSARTAVMPGYGFKRAATQVFKTVTLFQFVVSAIMVLLLLDSTANVFPFLHEMLETFKNFLPH
jgi:hypothetical protein